MNIAPGDDTTSQISSESIAADLEREGVSNVMRIRLGVDLATFHPARKARREEVL